MFVSCRYCGKTHPVGYVCRMKPRYDKARNSTADRFRHTSAWLKARERILDRDYHMCRVCNDGAYGTYAGTAYNSKGLSIHHIEPLAERYDLRLEDDNLITCCSWHHRMADDEEISRGYLHNLAQTSPRWGKRDNLTK